MPRITPKQLVALKQNIEKADVMDLDDAMGDLEDVGLVDDDDAQIMFSALPKIIPDDLRREIAALSAQHIALGHRIQSILDDVYTRVEDAAAVKEAKELADRPKCECCQQPLPAPRKRR